MILLLIMRMTMMLMIIESSQKSSSSLVPVLHFMKRLRDGKSELFPSHRISWESSFSFLGEEERKRKRDEKFLRTSGGEELRDNEFFFLSRVPDSRLEISLFQKKESEVLMFFKS